MEVENRFTFHNSGLPTRSYDFFKTLRNNTKLCGISTLAIENRSIPAHRLIIAAAIPYFHDLFTGKDSNSEERAVDFHDVDPVAFESLLDYAYTCKIVITMENVHNLLYAACRLYVEEVREACCKYLVDRLHPENVLSIRNFATDQLEKICLSEIADVLKTDELLKSSYKNLLENIDIYVMENFSDVSKTEEFFNLPFSYFHQLLKSDELRVASEEEVFEALIKWVKKSLEQRKRRLPELLKIVRMPLLSFPYLNKNVAKEDLIRASFECRDLLDEARDYHHSAEDRSACTFTPVPRCYAETSSESAAIKEENIYTLYSNHKLTVRYLTKPKMVWNEKASACVWYHGASTAVAGDKLYCFSQDSVYSYKPSTDTFSPCRTMPFPRNFTGAAELSGKIYVCGGTKDLSGSLSASDVVECYNPKTKKWEGSSSMRECRQEPGVAKLGNYIYVSGGIKKSDVHKSVEKYETRGERWRSVPSMLSERYGHGFTALNGQLYACGGKNSTFKCIASAEVYNPVKNKWSSIAPMKSARFRFKLLPYCGKLFAIGGLDDQSQKLRGVEIYDPKTNKWSSGNEIDCEYFLSAEVMTS